MKVSLKNRKRFLLILVPALLAGFCAAAFARTDGIDSFAEEGMALWNVPGLAVSVVSGQDIVFRQGFGRTAIEHGEAIDEHTLFAIASTTKAMVVTGLLMLVDDDKLSLDDPITKYIPELHFSSPVLTEQIMVRDLLAHRTGLPSTDIWEFFMNMPMDEQIRRLPAVKPRAPLRTILIYQNTMYELAGLVIERVSGQRWDQFLEERLWSPLGMSETYGARGQAKKRASHVMPHVYIDDEVRLARWDTQADQLFAAGSVWSSIHDMSLWAQFLLRDGVTVEGRRLVSKENVAEMFRPQQLIRKGNLYPASELSSPNWRSYGLGWFQQDFQGRKIDFHTGSLTGLIAIIGLDRANDRAVIVLGNRDHAEMRHALLWYAMDASPASDQRDWNREVFELYQENHEKEKVHWSKKEKQRMQNTRPSLPPENFAGRYGNPAVGEIIIEHVDQRLVLKTPAIDFPLSHWHLDTFLFEYESWGMHEFADFRIGPDGKVSSLELFGESFEPIGEKRH